MQPYDQDRLFHRAMRRTDLLRASAAGVLLGLCIIISAYVSLAAGLWMGVSAMILLGALWSYSHNRRQQPVSERITRPALSEAFEQAVYTLPAAPPPDGLTKLFPEDARFRFRSQLTAAWQGLSFNFANVVVRSRERRMPLFHGQYLVVHTDWTLPGSVRVSEQTDAPVPEQSPDAAASTLPAVDSALLRAYRVETDAPRKASSLLACRLLQTLLLENPGTRLLVEDATVSLAIPSDEPFFELTGLEESTAQVRSANQRQIAILQSWLDSILAVEMPEA